MGDIEIGLKYRYVGRLEGRAFQRNEIRANVATKSTNIASIVALPIFLAIVRCVYDLAFERITIRATAANGFLWGEVELDGATWRSKRKSPDRLVCEAIRT